MSRSFVRLLAAALALLPTAAVAAESRAEAKVFPPLPVAVSSFGAAVADGYVYVYGGHAGKTHEYSTESVSHKFFRLKLDDPKVWEELPGGPGLQGLALVAYKDKIYRVGGMQPRNAHRGGCRQRLGGDLRVITRRLKRGRIFRTCQPGVRLTMR